MLERAKRLLDSICRNDKEGVLVCDPSNMFYVTGYTGEGVVLLTRKVFAIVTDFRYTEMAEQQAPGFSVEMVSRGQKHEDIVASLCAQAGVDTLYYEDEYLTVATFESCRKAMPDMQWKVANGATQKLREMKDESELAFIAGACRITGDSFERLLPKIKAGMTEKELALMLDYDMMLHGASAPSFSTIVAAGAHGSLPHAVPGDYKVQMGDMITFDFGARFGNYCADMTRTVAVGEPSEEMRKVYEVVLEAQKRSQDAVAAGKCCKDIDANARNYIDEMGYQGRFGHGLGHSVGIDIHENPRFSTNCSDILKVGQVMTVEPGIYLPGVGGVRIENTVVVREGCCEVLTKPTRELIIL